MRSMEARAPPEEGWVTIDAAAKAPTAMPVAPKVTYTSAEVTGTTLRIQVPWDDQEERMWAGGECSLSTHVPAAAGFWHARHVHDEGLVEYYGHPYIFAAQCCVATPSYARTDWDLGTGAALPLPVSTAAWQRLLRVPVLAVISVHMVSWAVWLPCQTYSNGVVSAALQILAMLAVLMSAAALCTSIDILARDLKGKWYTRELAVDQEEWRLLWLVLQRWGFCVQSGPTAGMFARVRFSERSAVCLCPC